MRSDWVSSSIPSPRLPLAALPEIVLSVESEIVSPEALGLEFRMFDPTKVWAVPPLSSRGPLPVIVLPRVMPDPPTETFVELSTRSPTANPEMRLPATATESENCETSTA